MSADVGGVAADRLASFIDRILRLREEEDALKSDVKEVYAEAKGEGFDKTALGALVTHLRKQAANPEREAERSAFFDLYLEAYTNSASHTYAGAREPAHTREERANDDVVEIDASLLATVIRGSETGIGRKALRIALDAVADQSINSADQTTTDARPDSLTRAQVQGLPDDARNGSPDTTVGITGAHIAVEVDQLVKAPGAGEEVAASSDPAPASDRPKVYDALRDPDHVVTPHYRKLLCAQYEVDDDRFDAFRAGLIEGLTHQDAAARASLVEA